MDTNCSAMQPPVCRPRNKASTAFKRILADRHQPNMVGGRRDRWQGLLMVILGIQNLDRCAWGDASNSWAPCLDYPPTPYTFKTSHAGSIAGSLKSSTRVKENDEPGRSETCRNPSFTRNQVLPNLDLAIGN
ncbi:hypothetical protein Cob_v005000 [Colletotrichum orbiculare MAFF 240422]|uniref:Uncharacterized protein n=1 Tax=Colletotrichum orbiculare (strain 104-T / ATCC 96160 / CBS 514.97 / LARS 414 / MAFF 240422) TaxID=1213857 RepID=A0A484FWD4_COLOR|nr:hypothetical protein Cob_v005000 [Colletotrichum orbiculare MAFF 240422]